MGTFLNEYSLSVIFLWIASHAFHFWINALHSRRELGSHAFFAFLIFCAFGMRMSKTGQTLEDVAIEAKLHIEMLQTQVETYWGTSTAAKIWRTWPIAEIGGIVYWVVFIIAVIDLVTYLITSLMWVLFRLLAIFRIGPKEQAR